MNEPQYQSECLKLYEIIHIMYNACYVKNIYAIDDINVNKIILRNLIIDSIQEKLDKHNYPMLTPNDISDNNTVIDKFGSIRGFYTFIYEDLLESLIKKINDFKEELKEELKKPE